MRNNVAFARHLLPSRMMRRLFLAGRRRIEQRLRPELYAAPAMLNLAAPLSPFPPTTAVALHVDENWTFSFLGRALSCGSKIDWRLAGTGDANQLWNMNLHYLEWSESLPNAAFVDAVEQWMTACPPYVPGSHRDGWSAYSLSIRCVVLLQQVALRREALGHETVTRFVQNIARQLNFLQWHLETDIGGNHLIKNISALLWGAASIISDDTQRWHRRGMKLLNEALDQILPDGMHFERSPSYHAQVLGDLIGIRHALGCDPFRGRLDDAIGAATQVVADLGHPDGGPALFGDSGLAMARSPSQCLAAAAALTGNRVAARIRFDLPHGGYAGLRNEDDLWLIDAGPLCPDELPGHAHGDIGAIEWSVAGERMIVDQGVFEYVAGERRHRSRSAASHNTLAAPGADQGVFFGAFRLGARSRISRREVLFTEDGVRVVVGHDGFVGPNGGARHERSIEAGADRITIDDRLDRPIAGAAVSFLLAPQIKCAPVDGGIELTGARATCRIETDGEATIEDAVWWPDMGVERATHRVRIALADRQCHTVLTVLTRKDA